MDNQLVSVIVPIYNSENTLERCLDSISRQSYLSLEIILVNDGSQDSTAKICEAAQARDARVKYIYQHNGGVSSARNNGIKNAKGTWLLFVDSDDMIPPDFALRMVDATGGESDLAICGFDCMQKGRRFLEICADNGIELRQQFMEKFLSHFDRGIINSPCNKIYRLSLIREHNIAFPSGIRLGEDLLFNLSYLPHCSSVAFTSLTRYACYFDNTNSLSREYSEDFFDKQKQLVEKMFVFLEKNTVVATNLEFEKDRRLAKAFMAALANIANSSKSIRVAYKESLRLFAQDGACYFLNLDALLLSKKEQIVQFLVRRRLYLVTFLAIRVFARILYISRR